MLDPVDAWREKRSLVAHDDTLLLVLGLVRVPDHTTTNHRVRRLVVMLSPGVKHRDLVCSDRTAAGKLGGEVVATGAGTDDSHASVKLSLYGLDHLNN